MSRSLASALLHCKCPRCREGNIYQYPNHQVFQFAKTNKECPVCKLQFEREPGFFFGAMYISYAFSVAIVIATGLLVYGLMDDPPFILLLLLIPGIALLALPFSFRYSRVLFLYAFGGVDYRPEIAGKIDNL